MKNIVFLTLTLTLFLTNCSKIPENIGPPDQFSTANYPSNVTELTTILNASYSIMRSQSLWGFNFLAKCVSNSEHAVNSFYDGQPEWNQMAACNLSSTNPFVNGAWGSFYAGIKNCNVTIEACDKFEAQFEKKENIPKELNLIRGQAYCLRGFYYMMIETLFGEEYMKAGGKNGEKMGVPIFDVLVKDLNETQKARSTVKEVWSIIESDFTKAAMLLKGHVWDANNRGRVTEWTAKGLLGKAYVYTENWALAKTTLLDVIQNSGKELMPYGKYRDAFVGLKINEFNEESLFEINVEEDTKGGFGIFGGNPHSTTATGLIWSPWALGEKGVESNATALGWGNETFHSRNVTRFGYTLPKHTLVQNVNYDSTYNPKTSGFITDKWPKMVMDPVYYKEATAIRKNKKCDPRLFVCASQPWLDSLIIVPSQGWTRVARAAPARGDHYGWSLRKYAPRFKSVFEVNGADASNIYLLRMADIYLLYAETAMHSGDNATALEYLNKVKRRAYSLPVNTPSSSVDYASLTDKTTASGDKVLQNNPLYYERWAELFNEGHWWMDVCRWKIGANEAAYYDFAYNVPGGLVASWDESKAYRWPIPSNEMNANTVIRNQQNPGY